VSKRGTHLKCGYLSAVSLSIDSVKMIADRHRHAACHNKHRRQATWKCQRRWPWMTLNSKIGFFVIFLPFWVAEEWSATKSMKIDQDYLRTDLTSISLDFLLWLKCICQFAIMCTIQHKLLQFLQRYSNINATIVQQWHINRRLRTTSRLRL